MIVIVTTLFALNLCFTKNTIPKIEKCLIILTSELSFMTKFPVGQCSNE